MVLTFLVVCHMSCKPVFISSIQSEYEALAYDEEVVVLQLNETIPKESIVLGEAKLRDGGFSLRCNKEALIDLAKQQARRWGGNIIKITKDKEPNFWDSCHRLNLQILRTKP